MLNITSNATFVSKTERPAVRIHADSGVISQKLPEIPQLNQLIKQPLFPNKPFKAKALNDAYQWEVARMQALLQTIFSEGVTDKDEGQLDQLESHLKELEASVDALELAEKEEKERTRALSLIDQAQEMVTETRILIKKMKIYESASEKLNEACDSLVDLSYSPEEGNPLLASETLIEASEGLADLLQALSLKGESAGIAHAKLLLLLKQDLTHLSWVIEDWVDGAQEEARTELADLSKVAKTKEPYEAFWRHLEQMQKNLGRSLTNLNELKAALPHELQPLLESWIKSIKEGKKGLAAIEKQAKNEGKGLPSSSELITYGDANWTTLSKQFPSKQPPSWIRSKVTNLIDSEHWSPQTKDLVYRLFAAMQLGQQVQGTIAAMGKAKGMEEMAKRLQEQAIQALPEAEVTKIEKETSLLGTLLSDKYAILTDEHLLERLTSKYPEVQASIKSIIQEYGDQPPSHKEILTFMDAFKIQRLLGEGAGSPFSHMSIEEWWNKFVFDKEAEPFTANIDLLSSEEALVIADQPLTSSASKAESFFSSVINLFRGKAPAPAEMTESFSELKTSLKTLSTVQKTLIEGNVPSLASLRDDVALLQRQLLKTISDIPEGASMLKNAQWLQRAEDQCYAVEVLEAQIATAMEVRREEILRTSDEELHKFGKKHENIVKQARLVEALQISGVQVPLPQGISTDDIGAFLKENAPEIFKEWDELKREYHNYNQEQVGYLSKLPFLRQSYVQARLQKIERGIQKAFSEHILELSPEMENWLEEVNTSGEYLMIRSTGSEDSRATANAGGNLSLPYVLPEKKEFNEAVGQVVRSYFGYASLQNRINAGLNPFEEELKLAVTTQRLIGEPIGGAKSAHDIPISLVLFTNEPLYVGEEKFRVMRISATYGHGEGVVGNKGIASDTALVLISTVHPDRLYVLYDNQEKPERLAPLSTEEGIVLEKIANPSDFIKKPVLTPTLLARLFHWGIIGEKFFDDHPTDMEIVIKHDTIYPVQARDINRPQLLPTYLDLKKIAQAKESPAIERLNGEMIVPGKASVIEINNKRELLYAETLEEAERLFVKGQNKLVVVSQQEPANSHPVVNFSALGMPCLYFKDRGKIEELFSKMDSGHSLVACIQTATLHLWDNTEELAPFVSRGFAVHPAKIAISSFAVETPPIQTTEESPQEIKDLVQSIQISITQQQALEVLEMIKKHPYTQKLQKVKEVLAEKITSMSFVPEGVTQSLAALQDLDIKIKNTFQEVQTIIKVMQPEERLKSLFHIKVLETLLFSKGSSLGQYSVLDVIPISAGAETLIEYQKQLSFPARFSDLVLHGQHAFSEERRVAWTNFLQDLERATEKGNVSSEEANQFIDLLSMVNKSNVLPLWINIFFGPAWSASHDSIQTMQALISGIKPSDGEFTQLMSKQRKEIQALRKQLDLFSDPKTFKKGMDLLKQQVKFFSSTVDSPFHLYMENASPLAKIIALEVMKELVDTFDAAIKQMKLSSQFRDLEKIRKLKEMLDPYLQLLKGWAKNEVRETDLLAGNISYYFIKLREILHDRSESANQLYPSKGFSVAAAVLGSAANFERHLPETLEDVFTLIHQDLLACIGMLNNELLPEEKLSQALPERVQKILEGIKGASSFQQRIGVEVTPKGLSIKYNVPLANHSSNFELQYDKVTDQIVFKVLFLGQARGRWPTIEEWAKFLDELKSIPLTTPIKLGEQEVSFSWKIDEENFPLAMDQYREMRQLSSNPRSFAAQLPFTIESIVKYGRGDLEQLDLLAEKGLQSTNPEAKKVSLKLLPPLVQLGKAHDLAMEAAKNAITSASIETKELGLQIFSALVKAGKGYKEASQALLYMVEADSYFAQLTESSQMFREIVEKAEGPHFSLKASDQETIFGYIRHRVNNLFSNPFEMDLPIDLILKRINFQLFSKIEKYFKISGEFRAFDNLNSEEKKYSLWAMQNFLLKQYEENYSIALDFAERGIKDSDSGVRMWGIILFKQLFSENRGREEAILIANEIMKNTDPSSEQYKDAQVLLEIASAKS